MSLGTHKTSPVKTLTCFFLALSLCLLALALAACEKLDADTTTGTSVVPDEASTTSPPTTMSGAAAPSEGGTAASAAGDGAGDVATTAPTSGTIEMVTPSVVSLSPMITTPAWTLYQESDPHIVYSTNSEGTTMWGTHSYATASGGAVRWTLWTGISERVTIAFRGTGIAVVVLKNTDCCQARLSLDGGPTFLVDTYGLGMASTVVWTSPDLASARHVLTIESTGVHNPLSADYYLLFDAVSVKGTLVD